MSEPVDDTIFFAGEIAEKTAATATVIANC
jgi:hypothetical protein